MKRTIEILLFCIFSALAYGQAEYTPRERHKVPKDSVYLGTIVKFDMGSAIFLPARYNGNAQDYEVAVSVRLMQKLFPTFEVGYSQNKLSIGEEPASIYDGKGGFMRLGLDYSVLRKYKGDNHLFVGLRVGTSLQNYDLLNVKNTADYWQTNSAIDYPKRFAADAWGEIVAGVQVQIYKNLSMGWYVRYKILMTRGKDLDGIIRPAYILGYGTRNDSAFGWNYYIGWQF